MIVPDWLSLTADGASLAGFFITLAVWFQTRALRKAFSLRGRLPELSSDLKSLNGRLLEGLRASAANLPPSRAELESLGAILRNLSPKLPRSQREPVVRLLKKCDRRRRRLWFWQATERHPLSAGQMWEIYDGTQGIIESLEQTAKDFKWS